MNKNLHCLITGGAGFIGSQLADNLLSQGHKITVLDNLSWGKKEFFAHNLENKNYQFIKIGLLNTSQLFKKFPKNVDIVFHLAANSDIMRGTLEPAIDLRNTTIATFNLLEAMKSSGAKKIFFTSGSGVYGDVGKTYTKESFGPLLPISMYGATKLSAEAMISAFVNLYDMQAWVLRPANIIGPRATHGVVFDFINKLKKNPKELKVFGDGSQSKSYLYVEDVIAAINIVWKKSNESFNLFNISSDSFIKVSEIAEIVVGSMGLKDKTKIKYTGGNRGWKGDVPIVRLDKNKIYSLGWKPKYSSKEAVIETIRLILKGTNGKV